MKLHIVDTSWGIDRKTGQRLENIAAEVTYSVNPGPLPPVGPSRHVFTVLEIRGDIVALELSGRSKKVVELKVGEPYVYQPLSMDGGHIFKLELE